MSHRKSVGHSYSEADLFLSLYLDLKTCLANVHGSKVCSARVILTFSVQLSTRRGPSLIGEEPRLCSGAARPAASTHGTCSTQSSPDAVQVQTRDT